MKNISYTLDVFSLQSHSCLSNHYRHPLAQIENLSTFDSVRSRHGMIWAQNFVIYPYNVNMKAIMKMQRWKMSTWTHIFTSQDFSWLQNGQLNVASSGWIARFFGGGFLFDFRRPIIDLELSWRPRDFVSDKL